MKRLIAIAVILFSFLTAARAQFETVYLGINGLTCSQCSRTVEMSLRKLDCVAEVLMNLQHTEGVITLKKNKKADIDKIAQAVFDAGFSVRYLQADFNADKTTNATDKCFKYNGDEFVLAEAPKESIKGNVKLKFIGKKFMPKNEYKKQEDVMNAACGNTNGKVYHVALIS